MAGEMKILFPFVGDSVGGSHLSSLELCNILRENGYSVLIVVHHVNGPLVRYLKENHIEYCGLGAASLAGESPKIINIFCGMISNMIPFAKFIQKNNVDMVHGNDLRINLTWSAATLVSKAKFIWHQRTILSASWLWKCIPFLSNHFIGISNAVLNSAPNNFGPSKKSLVHNAFNTEVRHSQRKSRALIIERFQISSETIIGYVGRLVSYKNVDFLIKCMNSLTKTHQKSVHFLVIGTGSNEYVNYLKGIVRELQLESSISFLGFVSDPLELISGLDILVASSTRDAFGRTIIEAMLQSTPVLAANKGGHLEIVQDEWDGLLYEANNENSFVEKAIRLIEDKYFRESLAIRGLKKSVSQYSKKRVCLEIKRIYNSVKNC